jgi:hypothetical protein
LAELLPKGAFSVDHCAQQAVPRIHIDGGRNSNSGLFSTAAKNNAGRQLRRNTKKKIKISAVYAGQVQWPGAGSNRRPSDFQDYGNSFALIRHRP